MVRCILFVLVALSLQLGSSRPASVGRCELHPPHPLTTPPRTVHARQLLGTASAPPNTYSLPNNSWATTDVSSWLRELGVNEDIVSQFNYHQVDGTMLLFLEVRSQTLERTTRGWRATPRHPSHPPTPHPILPLWPFVGALHAHLQPPPTTTTNHHYPTTRWRT